MRHGYTGRIEWNKASNSYLEYKMKPVRCPEGSTGYGVGQPCKCPLHRGWHGEITFDKRTNSYKGSCYEKEPDPSREGLTSSLLGVGSVVLVVLFFGIFFQGMKSKGAEISPADRAEYDELELTKLTPG